MSKQIIERLSHITGLRIYIQDYEMIVDRPHDIVRFLKQRTSEKGSILCDDAYIPEVLWDDSYRLIESPLGLWKSISTEDEVTHVSYSFEIDHVALLESMCDVVDAMKRGHEITEDDVARLLHDRRRVHPHFLQDSFQTIAASGTHATSPHYAGTSPSPPLRADELFLLDSGGHYLYGTTDLTRVYWFGQFLEKQPEEQPAPPDALKRDVTLVLKAHIALALYRGTSSASNTLDSIVREVLLQTQRNYAHGTGHGVGYCTDVHEGVQRISPVSSIELRPGMIVSNEPGYYDAADWGIRIENILCMKQDAEGVYYFDMLSYFPIQTYLIDFSLLDARETAWLQAYHDECRKRLIPHISERAKSVLDILTKK